MGSDFWRDYPRNPREFEGWLRANTVLGSILAMGILAMPWRVSTLRGDPTWQQNSQASLHRSEGLLAWRPPGSPRGRAGLSWAFSDAWEACLDWRSPTFCIAKAKLGFS
jgi:hypothetical protein